MRRDILIDSVPGEVRIAVLEDDLLSEVFIERSATRGVAGNVYKGRVRNILPGMQSAFVDIGLERDAFLYVEDAISSPEQLTGLESGEPEPEALESATAPRPRPAIETLVTEGQDIVVQVTKEPLSQKGARITTHVTFPGRYLVYLPGVPHVGVSRKIQEPAERDRLKSIGQALVERHAPDGGLIVRTAGEGRGESEFDADARYLADLWSEVGKHAAVEEAPALLHREAGAVGKVLRDIFHADVAEVSVDSEAVRQEAIDVMQRLQPELTERIRLYCEAAPLFEARGVVQQLERALRPRVWLKSGGHIVINQTEALVAIDVNTGKYVGKRRLEDTILKTNLEAVREVVRQVRLRDLGGIIVVDFIDMEEESSRREVIEALQAELQKDRSRSRMLQISEFGLVEITRQRTKASLDRVLCRPCPACSGSGRVKAPETIFFEIVREAGKLLRGGHTGEIVVRLHPARAAALDAGREALADALDRVGAERIVIETDLTLHHDQWHLVPFRQRPDADPRPEDR